MKQINAVKLFLVVALLTATSFANGQIHPLAFSNALGNNWYANYVGLRFEVTTPAVIAGDKQYTAAWSGTTPWGAPVTTPIVNIPIIMDSTADSFGCAGFGPTVNMTGKIAVIWRGPAASACNFSDKAINAQNAGAIACVFINEFPTGPIGMSAATVGASIPVFMISNADGIAISGQYRSGVPVKMTITPWGLNNQRDLGFVPNGAAGWHAYAVPKDQLPAGVALPAPYKQLDGAFIANYGSSNAINVELAGSLDYTPDATGVKTNLHKDTLSGESTFYGLAHLPQSDSIIAMFSAPEYSFAPPTTGTGRYDLTYTVFSDSVDQYPPDNTTTLSFYTSDSVYSKGKYDFVNKAPVSTQFFGLSTGGNDFVWGNMFYVAHGHDAVRTLQFSLDNQSNVFGPIDPGGSMNLYVFKWNDTLGGRADSIVENGELEMISQGNYPFKSTDTSGVILQVYQMTDPSTGNPGAQWLDSNSWYYVAAEVPAGFFLGCDGGQADPFPRLFGRFHSTKYIENSNFDWGGDYKSIGGAPTDMVANPNSANFPVAFPGITTLSDTSLDSINYANQKGLIPSIAMIITATPDTSHIHDGVAGVVKPYADVNLYPNPANGYVDVSVSLQQQAATVTYTLLDGLGRFVSKQTHNNVQNEKFTMSTSNLASGTYFLVINANDHALTRKFTVIR